MEQRISPEGPPHDGPGPAPAPPRAVAGWVLYDLANTIFSLNIVSLYFPLWVVNVRGAGDAAYGYAHALSMAVIFFGSPFLGALTDQAARRMPFLVVSTLACVAATAALGLGGLFVSLALFALANIAYQAGSQFSDALLPSVSSPESRGRISGLGVGVGYLGSLLGLGTGYLILQTADGTPGEDRYRLVFQLTALAFLIFSLPCFLWVKERRQRTVDGPGLSLRAVRAAFGQAWSTFRSARQHPQLFRFLIGRVFYTDAVNTVIAFMGIYVTNEVGFSAAEANLVLLVAILFAVAGGFLWGRVTDAWGAKRTLMAVLVLWMIVFAWAFLVGLLALPGWSFWPVPALAGIALGGTWTADRPLMLRLSPPDRIGEFFGLYGMVGRFAAITGPLLWALVADTLGFGRPAAILVLFFGVVVAWAILRPLRPEGPP